MHVYIYIYIMCVCINIYIYKENTDVNTQKEHVLCMPSNLGLWRHRLNFAGHLFMDLAYFLLIHPFFLVEHIGTHWGST